MAEGGPGPGSVAVLAAAAGSDAAVRTVGLAKTYRSAHGDVLAVRGLDLEVARGEFFGLLGPNGAGKSTTIGMLTTLVKPTGGSARLVGHDVVTEPVAVKRRIGVVSQNNTLDRQLTVRENLEFRGRFFGLSGRAAVRRAQELLDLFDLGGRAKAMVYELSGGQARRVMIGRALMHRPDLLFLDEPTAAIDPQTRINLWDTLRGLHEQGQTIVLTTHYMEEAETLCERVAVVDDGRLLACGTVAGLKDEVGPGTLVSVTFDGPADPVAAAVRGRAGVDRVEVRGATIRLFVRSAQNVVGDLVLAGVAVGLTVRDSATVPPSLENVFLALTGRDYRE
ncbi:ABC transporter ATP-binding protein [Actinokineospora enzanensis]|uniref:ABC transporter ATP-binding protein n=1 Tax=Actinokineospora enzanensis TaxID=155975 RepID=UPI00037A476F|nr:ABC transporter ATP-binding protein [Actinokineospora enzanensis]